MQVEKEERGNKGAALTTFVSLAGRYLVLMPNNPRGGGVSPAHRGRDREELKENLDQLDYPKGMSLIARTAGIGRSAAELQWDLNYMLKLWDAIDGASKAGKGAFLIYQESSLVIRAIRDYFTADIGEILIDTDDIYEQAQQFMNHVMPETAHQGQALPRRRAAVQPLPDRAPDRDGLQPHGQPALGRRHRDRPHRGAGRRWTSTRRAPRAAATSRKPRPAPTSRRPTRSRARCACATSAA